MPISGKEIIRLLKKRGRTVVSQRGSHVKLGKDKIIIIIPIHGNKDLGLGLIRSIEKQTKEEIL